MLKNVLAGLSGGERKRNTVFSQGVCSPVGIHSRFRYWKGSSECNFCTIIFHKFHDLKISSAKRWPDAARAPCAFPRASHHPPTLWTEEEFNGRSGLLIVKACSKPPRTSLTSHTGYLHPLSKEQQQRVKPFSQAQSLSVSTSQGQPSGAAITALWVPNTPVRRTRDMTHQGFGKQDRRRQSLYPSRKQKTNKSKRSR